MRKPKNMIQISMFEDDFFEYSLGIGNNSRIVLKFVAVRPYWTGQIEPALSEMGK